MSAAKKTWNMKFVIINLQFHMKKRSSFTFFIYFFPYNSIAQFLYKENANMKKMKIIKNWTKPNQFLTAPSKQ